MDSFVRSAILTDTKLKLYCKLICINFCVLPHFNPFLGTYYATITWSQSTIARLKVPSEKGVC